MTTSKYNIYTHASAYRTHVVSVVLKKLHKIFNVRQQLENASMVLRFHNRWQQQPLAAKTLYLRNTRGGLFAVLSSMEYQRGQKNSNYGYAWMIMGIHNYLWISIMDSHNSNYGYPKLGIMDIHKCYSLWIYPNSIMDIHNWIQNWFMNIHNYIMDIHNHIMDIPDSRWFMDIQIDWWISIIQLWISLIRLWISIIRRLMDIHYSICGYT